MSTVVTLTASAAYGFGGKQYIARITGRDAKFTFSREFVGRNSGKRNQTRSFDLDESDRGLYIVCDIDRKGDKDETYYLCRQRPGDGFDKGVVSKERAMAFAKLLDLMSFDAAVEQMFPVAPPVAPPVAAESVKILEFVDQ